jgi:DNA polymerase phi
VNGSHQFDKLTKTKTVESILTSMDTEGIKNYIDFLLRQFNEEDAAKSVHRETTYFSADDRT